VTLADTPTTWVEGPSISTLHALAIFAGIPLLVILGISLLVYAPSWVHGPRYRPGQPWDSKSEWFGVTPAVEPSKQEAPQLLDRGGDTSALDDERTAGDSGGASAGW
jgi:hypothetical protein